MFSACVNKLITLNWFERGFSNWSGRMASPECMHTSATQICIYINWTQLVSYTQRPHIDFCTVLTTPHFSLKWFRWVFLLIYNNVPDVLSFLPDMFNWSSLVNKTIKDNLFTDTNITLNPVFTRKVLPLLFVWGANEKTLHGLSSMAAVCHPMHFNFCLVLF